MKQMEWQLVPTQPTPEMVRAMAMAWQQAVEDDDHLECTAEYIAALGVAPEPPHLSMTKEEAATFQEWRGMDGACAFHLIERHANGWGDTARMMEAWLAANVSPSNA